MMIGINLLSHLNATETMLPKNCLVKTVLRHKYKNINIKTTHEKNY